MTRRGDDADAACPPSVGAAAGDASRAPSGSARAAGTTGDVRAIGTDRPGTSDPAPSAASPGPGDQPAWPPLVHAPAVDRETLLRRICGG